MSTSHDNPGTAISDGIRMMKLPDPPELITEDLKGPLTEELMGLTVEEVVGMSRVALAQRLMGLPGVQEDDLPDLATELIKRMRYVLGIDDKPAPAVTAPSAPGRLIIEQAETPATMKLLPLLTYLANIAAGDTDEWEEGSPNLNRHKRYTDAIEITDLVVIPAEDGSPLRFDPVATYQYMGHLAGPGGIPQRLWGTPGRRPTTFVLVFEPDSWLWFDPFTFELISGLDRFGKDWRLLDKRRRWMIFWAMGTRHQNLPMPFTDPRRLTMDLFAADLPDYLQEIYEDYLAACKTDPDLASQPDHFTEAQALAVMEGFAKILGIQLPAATTNRGRLPFSASAPAPATTQQATLASLRLTDFGQRKLSSSGGNIVRANAVVGACSSDGGNIVLTNCVGTGNLSTDGGNVSFRNGAFLGKMIRTDGGDVSGTVRVLAGNFPDVRTSGGNDTLEVIPMSEADLAAYILQLGVVPQH